MVVKGVDVGYSYTKDNEERIFRSSYSLSDTSVIGSGALMIDGKNYFIGNRNGLMTSDVDKTEAEINKVCILYNLIKSNVHDVALVVGLPIGQYNEQRKKLREAVLSYNKCTVQYDNNPFLFKIYDVIVCPQGVSSLYTLKNLKGDYIIIDLGGLTVDTCMTEFTNTTSSILLSDTWYCGMRTLYSKIIEQVNNKYNLKLGNQDAEKILLQGLTVRGATQDLGFLKPILQDYIDNITEEIKLKYPTETVPIYLVGGGTSLLFNAFSKRFNNVNKVDNPQFANALGYYNIGYHKFIKRGLICGRL